MQKEVELAFGTIFYARIWVVNPTIVIKTIVLKQVGVSKELTLSKLCEDAL